MTDMFSIKNRLAGVFVLLAACCIPVSAEDGILDTGDFTFEGPLGSDGTTIVKTGVNHFTVTLGHAPGHPDWGNKPQFTIKRHAKGNSLRLDVEFDSDAYAFNEYFHSYSYDGIEWHPVHWEHGYKESPTRDTLIFPTFTEDTVYVGHQVPMSFEMLELFVRKWKKHKDVTVHTLGQSIEGRNIYRITITNGDSTIPLENRWVHYIANQHPGEHNAQWRITGMIDWLLSKEGADTRRRSICHFILMMYPDAPSHGWYRVGAEGVDGNRSYRVAGANSSYQAHEAYICQKDLEELMQSPSPVTDLWSMHTWGGIVEPIMYPGPEVGTTAGPWTDLRDAIEKYDTSDFVKPVAIGSVGDSTHWNNGPHIQFGITTFLCEGGGAIYTKAENVESGTVIMRGIADYYTGTRQNTAR